MGICRRGCEIFRYNEQFCRKDLLPWRECKIGGFKMQAIIDRAKELLADGTVARVLGWKAGDLPYNPEPAYFETEESLKDFVYNGFC